MENERLERRLAAIVMADVVGYSKLMEISEIKTLQSLRRCRATVVEPIVAHNRGRIVKLIGDGILMEFSSAVGAANAAIEIQEQMQAFNAAAVDGNTLSLRIGINLGEVVGEGDDIFGEGVNIAARLEPLAQPGGIAISEKVFAEIRGKIDREIVDLGPQRLKNIGAAIRVYSIGAEPTTLGPKGVAQPEGMEFTKLAVLPLTNMSGNADDDYFADGVTEDLITELSRSKHLSVVARNTTFTFKNKSVNVAEIGRQLDADFVLEGSVRQAGRRVRVTVQLIDVTNGAHVFAEKFDREMEDIFAVQDEIVEAIIGRLSFKLMDAAFRQREKSPTSSSSAYTLWLRGTAAFRIGDERRARDYWHDAVTVDPNYARALSSLAFLYAYWRFSAPDAELDSEREIRAREFAARAIANDRTDTEVLSGVSSCFLMIGDHSEAMRYSEMALALCPRDSSTLVSHAFVIAFCGRHDEGLELAKRACRFEPHLAPGYISSLGDCYYLTRDFEAALKTYRGLIDRPDYFKMNEAACLAQLGRIDEARAIVDSLPKAFDTAAYVKNSARVCALAEDKELWVQGFRMAGAPIVA